jgi:hypothetical protein
MLITLLLFSFLVQADDMSSEKYCFSSPSQSSDAKYRLSAVQVSSDVVTSDGNCLVVQMRPHRRELIQRFILSSFPGTSVSFSSEDVQREPCRLKVEKIKIKTRNGLEAGINQKGVLLNQSDSEGATTETMQIQTIKDFELSVDQDEIRGTCRYLNSNRYEISLTVRKTPRPIVPVGLPPGTIVVVNQPPPDQETMVLQTQVQLSRGERIDIGGVVKDLKYKNKTVDIEPDLKYEASGQTASEKVWLSLQ